jgi:hypothetical protein
LPVEDSAGKRAAMTVWDTRNEQLAEVLGDLGFLEGGDCMFHRGASFLTYTRPRDEVQVHLAANGSFSVFCGDEIMGEGDDVDALQYILSTETGGAKRRRPA